MCHSILLSCAGAILNKAIFSSFNEQEIREYHKKNIELIKWLNDKVGRLEHQDSSKINGSKILSSSVSTQTEEIVLCHKCDYEAEDKYELDAHTWELHDTEANEDIVTCWYCDDDFETKLDLMKHKKREHADRVNNCIKYAEGVCPFGEDSCWYHHIQTGKYSGTKHPILPAKFLITRTHT